MKMYVDDLRARLLETIALADESMRKLADSVDNALDVLTEDED